MAYVGKNNFNPDALPAHAEPEQAAQMLTRPKPRTQSHSNSPASNQSPFPPTASLYQNKPPPPIPVQANPPQQQQHYQNHQPLQPPPQQQQYQSHHTQQQQQQPLHPQSYQHQPPYQQYAQIQQPPYQRQSPINNASAYEIPASLTPHRPTLAQQQNRLQSPPPVQPYRGSSPRPQASASSDASLFPLFKAVDQRGTGQLTEVELSAALVNGDFTSFDPNTIRMMIKMFDNDRSGTIGFEEFCNLWGFLAAWRLLFERFDEDANGTISYDEYSKALTAFGYNLSPTFVMMMYRMYDRRSVNSLGFDMFVQSCISLKRMTDVFKKYDSNRDGYITMSFEEFLTEILLQR